MGGKTGLYCTGVPIKENTKKGYKMAYPGDSVDLAYPTPQYPPRQGGQENRPHHHHRERPRHPFAVWI